MELKKLTENFTVCKIPDMTQVDLQDEFLFIGKTDEELSLVCRTSRTPGNYTHREDGWKGFRIEGILDFSMVGILSRISALLAENEIGIFVVSTFNTDYILVKAENFARTLEKLEQSGYTVL